MGYINWDQIKVELEEKEFSNEQIEIIKKIVGLNHYYCE